MAECPHIDRDERQGGACRGCRASNTELPGHGDGGHHIRVCHVLANVIVLIDGEDSRVVLVLPVQGEKVSRVLRDEDERVLLGVPEMNKVGLPGSSNVARPNHSGGRCSRMR